MKASTRSKKADAADVGSVFSPESPAAGIDSRRGVKDAMEHVMKGVFVVCGLVAIAFVLVISMYLIISGIPAIREVGLWNFLAGTNWEPATRPSPPSASCP